jgi:lipoyl(octanoyl) transferase
MLSGPDTILPLNTQSALQTCTFIDLGKASYKEVWDIQLDLFHQKIAAKKEGKFPEHHLLFVEHDPVYTFGKSAEKSNLLATPEMLRSLGAEVYEIERGGDITYHGPGQLVAYPIFDLEQLQLGVKTYVQAVENCIIQTLQEFDISAVALEDRIGVWMDVGLPAERKIAAIGIKCSRFVTMHGLALNVNTDLKMFGHIVPCGIPDKDVTSMAREKNSQIDMENVKNSLGKHFASIFGLNFTT